MFTNLSLLSFLLYSTFNDLEKSASITFTLLYLAKLNNVIWEKYNFTNGTGLLYLHNLLYHTTSAVMKGWSLNTVSCELGESFFKDFKSIIKNCHTNQKFINLKNYLQRQHFKKEVNQEIENNEQYYQKQKFKDLFKANFDNIF